MSERKGPPGWERGCHTGVFCTIRLHSPRLQPAAHPTDLAAADGGCTGGWNGQGANSLVGTNQQNPVRSLCDPCVVSAGSPRPRTAAGCPCRGSSALQLITALTLGAKPPREPRELGCTLGTPLPFQPAGQGEAEHGEEEEEDDEVIHIDDLASAGLCGCRQRGGNVLIPTGTPSAAPAITPLRMSTRGFGSEK